MVPLRMLTCCQLITKTINQDWHIQLIEQDIEKLSTVNHLTACHYTICHCQRLGVTAS